MEDRDYLALITDLMVEAAEGNEQVVVAPGEGRIDSAFLAGINNRLKAEGRCGELKLAERRGRGRRFYPRQPGRGDQLLL